MLLYVALLATGIDPSVYAKVGASFTGSPAVTTISGTGVAGFTDGAADVATYMTPSAVAFDPHAGAIVVADPSAERIRVVAPDGSVSTLAGNGAAVAGGLIVPPGFADGPGRSARFSNPSGVAVAPDGSIIVADTGNDVVRKIAGGIVTTIAGRPGVPGSADGAGFAARFVRPRGVAIAADGTIFVADGSNGIRAISGGIVSTVPLPAKSRDVLSVALWEDSAGKSMLWYTTAKAICRYNFAANEMDVYDATWLGADGVVAISASAVVATLPRRGALVFIEAGSTHRLVAGDSSSREDGAGAFADGPIATARFCGPAGIALDAQRRMVVADRCNRRVRVLPVLNARTASIDGIAAAQRISGTYHVVYVSNSFAYYDVMWDDSIEGRLEVYLNANRQRLGIPEPVRVDAVRSPAVGVKGQTDVIRSILGVGSVDLVIWSVNSYMFRSDFNETTAPLPEPDTAQRAAWQQEIVATQADLKAAGTKFVVFDQPFGTETGPSEDDQLKDAIALRKPEVAQSLRGSEYGRAFNLGFERAIAETGVPFHPEYARFVDYERDAHEPLYLNYDFHFRPRAAAFYADLIEAALDESRPWAP